MGASALSIDREAPGSPTDRVLFVFAHPADAILLAGGTMAVLSASGAAVTVLFATSAEDDPAVAAALRDVGVVDHRVLGKADARMHGAPERRYAASDPPVSASPSDDDALRSADPGEIAADVATVIAAVGALTVISQDGDDDDQDAVVMSRAARHASAVMDVSFSSVVSAKTSARLLSSARTERRTDVDITDVDITDVLDRKRDAIRALGLIERSESEPTVESFVRTDGGFPHDEQERPITWSEFTVGTRVVSLVAGLIVGAVVGALGTVIFQSETIVGAVVLQSGLVASLVVVTAILAGLRSVFETRFIPASAAIGLLGTIGLLSLESPGGSVLIPDAPLSYYWIYGPIVIAFVVLAWPDLHRFRRVRIAEPAASKGTPAP